MAIASNVEGRHENKYRLCWVLLGMMGIATQAAAVGENNASLARPIAEARIEYLTVAAYHNALVLI